MAGATLVNNEVSRVVHLGKQRSEGIDVVDFIVVGVTLSDRIRGGSREGVVVGNIWDTGKPLALRNWWRTTYW